MLIDAGMDTGKLLTYRTHHIAPDATTPSLTEELITLSDQLLQEYLPAYAAGSLDPKTNHTGPRHLYPQAHQSRFYFGHLQVGQSWSAKSAPFDWPRSRTRLGQTDVVVTAAHVAAPDENRCCCYKQPMAFWR